MRATHVVIIILRHTMQRGRTQASREIPWGPQYKLEPDNSTGVIKFTSVFTLLYRCEVAGRVGMVGSKSHMSLLRTRTQATADNSKESASTEASELLHSFAENLEDTFAIKVGCLSLAHFPSYLVIQYAAAETPVHQGHIQDTFKLRQATHDAASPSVCLIPQTTCAHKHLAHTVSLVLDPSATNLLTQNSDFTGD